MKQRLHGVVGAWLVIILVNGGCAQKGEIDPQYQLRDPENLDKDPASAIDTVGEAEVHAPIAVGDYGVPAYPDAQPIYTERLGSPEEDGEFKILQLATSATPEEVAEFYQQEVGDEAPRLPVSQRNSALFVWYKGPRAGQTLLIAEDGKGQTIISLNRTWMDPDNPLMFDTSTLRPEESTTPDQRQR